MTGKAWGPRGAKFATNLAGHATGMALLCIKAHPGHHTTTTSGQERAGASDPCATPPPRPRPQHAKEESDQPATDSAQHAQARAALPAGPQERWASVIEIDSTGGTGGREHLGSPEEHPCTPAPEPAVCTHAAERARDHHHPRRHPEPSPKDSPHAPATDPGEFHDVIKSYPNPRTGLLLKGYRSPPAPFPSASSSSPS